MTEAINIDDEDDILNLYLKRKFNKNQEKNLQKEWDYLVEDVFDLRMNMYTWFRDYMITGEFALENIINIKNKKLGIQKVKFFFAEQYIIRYDEEGRIEGFIVKNPYNKEERVIMEKQQMSYINTGKFEYVEKQKINKRSNQVETVDRSKLVLSNLEKVKKTFRQLDALEDGIVIYRLARSPERLVFNVDTGNMPTNKSNAYMKKIIDKFRRKLSYDPSTGEVTKQQATKAIVED